VNFLYLNAVRLFWFGGALIILLQDKLVFHKKINDLGTSFLDIVMRNLTHAGDGLFACLIVLAFLFIRIKTGLLLLLSFISTAVVVQLLKHTLFDSMKRPIVFFQNDPSFRTIEAFTYHTSNSFPSGHSASIFALCTVIAYQYRQNLLIQICLVIIAATVAFTRVYLSQHFLQDIVAGSLIGTLISHVICVFYGSKFLALDRPLRIKKQ
jgi:membrane-associated phospholipid phosphatase|tara:strand:+ start:47606 stop:48232 length:627 start_codon:yes stop_codon:yes gene_type:complete